MDLRLFHPGWYLTLLSGILIGLVGLGIIVVFGHTHELNVPWELPWGLLVAAAHYFALASAGLCLAVPILIPPEWPGRSEVPQKAFLLAGLLLLMSLGMVGIELSQPLRLSFGADLGDRFFPSLMIVGGAVLCYLLMLGAAAWSMAHGHRQLAVTFGLFGFLTVLIGMFLGDDLLRYFGHSASWFSAPVILINAFSALLLGNALLLLLLALPVWLDKVSFSEYPQRLASRLRAYLLFGLLLFMSLQFITLVTELLWGSKVSREMAHSLLWGDMAMNCWGCEYLLGLALPILLLIPTTPRPGRLLTALGFFLTGHLVFRYDLLVASQLSDIFREQAWRVNDGVLSLAPCLPKLAVVIGCISLFLLLASLNEKLIPFGYRPDTSSPGDVGESQAARSR